jgi:hypothetical protein
MPVIECSHKDREPWGRVCLHLLEDEDADYRQRFTGTGLEYELVCERCGTESKDVESALIYICKGCFDAIEENRWWDSILGSPEVLTRGSNLHLQHTDVDLPELAGVRTLDVQPIEEVADAWLACTSTGTLFEIRPGHRSLRTVAQVPHDALDFDQGEIRQTQKEFTRGPACVLRVSRNGEIAAVANGYGQKGIVFDLSTGNATMRLCRGNYHEDVSCFPLALVEANNRILVIHGTDWNRLDVSDARAGALLTEREPTSYKRGEMRPEHYLDYFHCQLAVSPNQEFVADNGWCWHPVGIVSTWNLPRWLHDNIWESESGESKKYFCRRYYYWDGPLCWLDDHHLAVWGYGEDDRWLIPAVRIFNVVTGEQERWFAGPKGSLAFDKYLFSFDNEEGTSVWDVETGERLLCEPGLCPDGYHRGAKQFLSLLEGGKVRISRLVSE